MRKPGEHILRTQHYVEVLARRLSAQEKYKKDLNEEVIELMFKSAPLHDIGKVGIPDGILCKQGDLTEDEYRIMKSHTLIGAGPWTGLLNGSTIRRCWRFYTTPARWRRPITKDGMARVIRMVCQAKTSPLPGGSCRWQTFTMP